MQQILIGYLGTLNMNASPHLDDIIRVITQNASVKTIEKAYMARVQASRL